MARPLKFQIVEQARSLIVDRQHWCRGHLAEDAGGVSVFPTSVNAVKRCGWGAVIAAAYQLVHVNDVRGHAAVLVLFDEVFSAQR